MTFRMKETPYPICDVYLTYQLEYWQRHEFRSFGRYIEISMIFIKKKLREKKKKNGTFSYSLQPVIMVCVLLILHP